MEPLPQLDRGATRVRRRALLGGAVLLGLGGVGVAAVGRSSTSAPRVRWSFQAAGDVRGMATDAGTVFVGTAHGAVHALDADTGGQRWAETLLLLAADPTIVGPALVASDRTDTYALDEATGRRLWQARGTICAARSDVVVASTDDPVSAVVALDPGGATRWSRPAADLGIGTRPETVLSVGAAHVASGTGLVTLDLATGAELWRWAGRSVAIAATETSCVVLAPAAGRDTVLLSLDARTGALRWRADHDRPSGRLSLDDRGATLYAVGGDQLSAWDSATGRPEWAWTDAGERGATASDLAASLAPATGTGDTVYLVAATGADRRSGVVALDARTGRTRWRLALPDTATGAGVVAPVIGDTVVVVAVGGRVYAVVD